MSGFVLVDRNGNPVADWRAWTRPKKSSQWRAGRSAMELARAWFVSSSPGCPRELAELLAGQPSFVGLRLVQGIPEHSTPLPERGEGRNHDLLLCGQADGGPVVISVEAKVDESFGEMIGVYWSKASRRATPTRAPERIEALLGMVFGARARPDARPWRDLRYQLLTAVAGTAIEAARRSASTAAVVVHEFRTEKLRAERVAANAEDFQAFVSLLLGMPQAEVVPGRLHGPAALLPGPHLGRAVDVFIGKIVFDWH